MSERNAEIQPDRFPSLDKQCDKVIYFDNRKLGGIQASTDLDNAKFNGCIIEHNGKYLMCYRAYSSNLRGSSNIFISEVKLDGTVVTNYELDLPAYSQWTRQYEDARLFKHLGKLYVSYVVVQYPPKKDKDSTYWCAIHVAELDPSTFAVKNHYVPDYNNNGKREAQKNWIFFSHGKKLYCIYDCNRGTILELTNAFKVKGSIGGQSHKFAYGQLRGGTAPIQTSAGLLHFAHSSITHPVRKRRYVMSPILLDGKKPFRIEAFGQPVFGSCQNPIINVIDTWWNPIVVFPMGAVETDTHFVVSAGVNDIYTALLFLDKNKVMGGMDDDITHFAERYYYVTGTVSQAILKNANRASIYSGASGTRAKVKIDNPKDLAFLLERAPNYTPITKEEFLKP